jgi:hypothetical protein
MDKFKIIDKNTGMCYAQKHNKYCYKYPAVFSIRQQIFAYLVHENYSKKNKLY